MAKRITCSNKDNGAAVIFDYDFKPFFLKGVDGIYKVANNIQRADNTNTDGSTYQGANTQERNIVISAEMCEDYQENRNILYKCFERDSKGVFTHEENGERRDIEYYVESVEIGENGVVRDITISLVATDPYFTDQDYTVVLMAGWDKNFTFTHQFKRTKEQLGTRQTELIKEIENSGSVGQTGIRATLTALGTVKNPQINNITTGEFIKLNITMQTGDILEIVTETNKKNVYLTRNGERSSVNGYIDEDSDFIQLKAGINTIRYGADTGTDKLNVAIEFRCKYTGV